MQGPMKTMHFQSTSQSFISYGDDLWRAQRDPNTLTWSYTRFKIKSNKASFDDSIPVRIELFNYFLMKINWKM